MKNPFAIAVDGPAGSGKSTVAKAVAKEMKLLYVDTGAMYRAVGLFCRCKGVSTKDENEVCRVLDEIQLEFKRKEDGQEIFLNGEDVTKKIRSQEVGAAASDVGAMLPVRKKLVEIQRGLSKGNSVIMDGRDIGTNVLPEAQVKIYLVAGVEERAKRRLHELNELGEEADLEVVKMQITMRDEVDMNRKHNPLCKAQDAIEVDTSTMCIAEVVLKIIDIIKKKME